MHCMESKKKLKTLKFLEIIRKTGKTLRWKHSGELILYKNFENGELFYNFTWILENYDSEFYNRSDIVELYYRCLNQLIELAVSHGFEGNLWHCFLCVYYGK